MTDTNDIESCTFTNCTFEETAEIKMERLQARIAELEAWIRSLPECDSIKIMGTPEDKE